MLIYVSHSFIKSVCSFIQGVSERKPQLFSVIILRIFFFVKPYRSYDLCSFFLTSFIPPFNLYFFVSSISLFSSGGSSSTLSLRSVYGRQSLNISAVDELHLILLSSVSLSFTQLNYATKFARHKCFKLRGLL